MRALTHKDFDKQYAKLRVGERERFKQRKNLFLANAFHPILNNHALGGGYAGYRSINVGGNLRAVFKMIDEETALFVDIDTHPNLYK